MNIDSEFSQQPRELGTMLYFAFMVEETRAQTD